MRNLVKIFTFSVLLALPAISYALWQGDITAKIIGQWKSQQYPSEWVKIYDNKGKLTLEKHFLDFVTKKPKQESFELYTTSKGETYQYKPKIGGSRSIMFWPDHDKLTIDGQGKFDRIKATSN